MPAPLDIVTDLFVDRYGYEFIDNEIPFTETAKNKIADLKEYLRAREFSIILLIQNEHLTREEINKIIRELSQQYRDFALFVTDRKGDKLSVHKSIKVEKDDKEYRSFKEMIYDPLVQNTRLFMEKVKNFDASNDDITTIELNQKIDNSLQTEKVTKKFYKEFQEYHKKFIGFIEGITEKIDCQWYASLMLNRLMFTYFIQKQGFLDGDNNYLENRLNCVKESIGKDNFYTFYREFLLKLFHKGFSAKPGERESKINKLIGKVPYLNGGLFDVHELEEKYKGKIQIPDKAFENLFTFFEKYTWYLDERPIKNNEKNPDENEEINPDVLGFIFEKYINQKQMGAYYTKEDITEYISKNTIIPYLFSAVKDIYPQPFDPSGEIWKHLHTTEDKYIYDAVKKGCNYELPANIATGVDTSQPNLIERRKDWNTPTDEEYALPTEIWRETVERRKRYFDLLHKINESEIISINDFITYNLDIQAFAKDILLLTDDEELLWNFYKTIEEITVLDPTCGSGAFLFAALGILEPLYEVCLERMREFITDKTTKRKHLDDFKKKIKDVNEHPNEKYYIYKSIILNNLYGVDIMREAVEIAKLRLFLKLASCAHYDEEDSNLGLEPLPDIDFNIKAGNSLVGISNLKELEGMGTLDFIINRKEITKKAKNIGKERKKFRTTQVDEYINTDQYHLEKKKIENLLNNLNNDLNIYLAGAYKVTQKKEMIEWIDKHQPFHWMSEFYEIFEEKGGFDIIIGNPPYVEYSKVIDDYTIKDYKTEACGNLYAFVIERNQKLIKLKGRSGMIIPHSAFCTDRMAKLISIFKLRTNWISTYDIRPSRLFEVDQRLAIYLTDQTMNKVNQFTTKYHRWSDSQRELIFFNIFYNINNYDYPNSISKTNTSLEDKIFNKIIKKNSLFTYLKGQDYVFFHNAPRYWIKALDRPPYFWNEKEGEIISSHIKSINVEKQNLNSLLTLLNSNLFYWWFIIFSNCRDLSFREIKNFKISLNDISNNQLIKKISKELMDDYQKNKFRKETNYKKTGKVIYDEYYPRYSKSIIDKIDTILAEHYGFTEEELDFIINYDIKFRMGKELEDDGEE